MIRGDSMGLNGWHGVDGCRNRVRPHGGRHERTKTSSLKKVVPVTVPFYARVDPTLLSGTPRKK